MQENKVASREPVAVPVVRNALSVRAGAPVGDSFARQLSCAVACLTLIGDGASSLSCAANRDGSRSGGKAGKRSQPTGCKPCPAVRDDTMTITGLPPPWRQSIQAPTDVRFLTR